MRLSKYLVCETVQIFSVNTIFFPIKLNPAEMLNYQLNDSAFAPGKCVFGEFSIIEPSVFESLKVYCIFHLGRLLLYYMCSRTFRHENIPI